MQHLANRYECETARALALRRDKLIQFVERHNRGIPAGFEIGVERGLQIRVVARDLEDRESPPYGLRVDEGILANLGVEFRLGRKGTLAITYPFAFSGRRRQLEARGVYRF